MTLTATPPSRVSVPRLSPLALDDRLRTGAEIAVLDVREVGVFSRKHLLLAAPAPLARLELLIDRLVPRRQTPVVLVDLDESLVNVAAARLQRLGYTDLSVLAGGTLAWEAAGLEVFTGENVPSKAYGEFIEVEAHTPWIDVEGLRSRIASGEKLVIVDGRTPEEFANFSLPGAHSVPNGELALRIRELAPDPKTLVVVNCAGRTRSIVGAQTLIDAGLPNPVVSLKDGTMAWLLAGHTLDHGRVTPLPEPTPEHVAAARVGAQAWSRRAGVRSIDTAELARLEADSSRTIYHLDTRGADEYRSGHLPGWRWAPGGQLVQATDQYVATRGARVVLADWDGVRAHVTGALLAQLGGLEVLVYAPPAHAALETGEERWKLLRDPALADAPLLSPLQAHDLAQSGAAVLFDVDRSLPYAKRHAVGAWFAAPSRVHQFLPTHATGKIVILTSADGVLAQRVASDLRQQGVEARAIRGGNAAWFEALLPTGTGHAKVLTGDDDAWYSGYAYEDIAERNARFQEYLQWEVNLADQLPRPGARPPFRVFRQATA
ncbi:MAG: rhodanese-like domain-containing protein [Pseudomonadota bacterium]